MIDVTVDPRQSTSYDATRSEVRSRRPRVLFLAPGDIGKGRVEPISWMQTCRAYAERGFDVSLVALNIHRPDAVTADHIWEHYGFDPCFQITVVPTPLDRDSRVSWFRFWAGLTSCVYSLRVMTGQAFRPTTVVIHTRLPVLAAPFILVSRLLPVRRRPHVVFETHSIPRRSHEWVVRGSDLVVTNSEKLARDVRATFRVSTERVRHIPLPPYNPVKPHDKREARAEVGVPDRAVVACYAGKMSEEHNEFLLRTAAALAERVRGFRFLLVGGNPEILDWTRKRAAELGVSDIALLTGFVPPAKVEWYQAAADVLVYYMPDSMQNFPYCTPAKGYEYQAAERPIVATDIPLFEEVFGHDRDRAMRVTERTPEALAAGVIEALALEDAGRAMTERAATWVKGRTWERRTEAILEALGL